MFLVQKLGFGWEEVHEIAEQIEHLHSPNFFERMDALLGYPKIDPHGSPIPDKTGKMEWIKYEKLSSCKAGDSVRLAAVIHTTDDFLKFLNLRELSLGLKLKIKTVEKFDGSMTISHNKKSEDTLSHIVCERLLVEKL
jgi:DtxR family Mn-dependent transcriptional regulator